MSSNPLDLQRANRPDMLMLPALLSDGLIEKSTSTLQQIIAQWHKAGCAMVSACAGSFFLAESGILNGGVATTHWSLAERFRTQFPQIQLKIEELLVEIPPCGTKGMIMCGGGMTAYIDVGLRVIAMTGGPALAASCARTLVWEPARPRQNVFSDYLPASSQHSDESVHRAEAWLELHIAERFSIVE